MVSDRGLITDATRRAARFSGAELHQPGDPPDGLNLALAGDLGECQ